MIDFSAVSRGQKRLGDFAPEVSVADLKAATDAQIDTMLTLVRDLSDAQVVFVATDSEAEGGIGWNVAHLIAHVTATSEENAAVSSILARGIEYPFEPRLRYETDWGHNDDNNIVRAAPRGEPANEARLPECLA